MFTKGDKVVLALPGSFNPPTVAHLRMLEVARDALIAKDCHVLEGLMSPVSDAYGKAGLVSGTHRLEMVKRAVETSTWIKAFSWEVTQPVWTRTVVVLRQMQEEAKKNHGDAAKVVLVVGADVVQSFVRIAADGSPVWTDEDLVEILNNGLVVIDREDGNPMAVISSLEKKMKETFNIVVTQDQVCPNAISSTKIRNAIKAEKSVRHVVKDPVHDYILSEGLYK